LHSEVLLERAMENNGFEINARRKSTNERMKKSAKPLHPRWVASLLYLGAWTIYPQTSDSPATNQRSPPAGNPAAKPGLWEPNRNITNNSAPDEITTRDGTTYKGVMVQKVDADGLRIGYTPAGGGIGATKLKFENLDESLQKRYGYDPRRAAAYEEEQAKLRADEASRQVAQESEKLKTVSKILSDYHKAHTYIGTEAGAEQNIFVCGDMACEVWDMVRTKGIEARIQVGNVENDINSMAEANHAWVMAEVAPGKWLALETTGGYVVNQSKNARYYSGHSFSNPKEFRDYQTLISQYNDAVQKQRNAVEDYNQLVSQYKAANGYDQGKLRGELVQKAAVAKQRTADVNDLSQAQGHTVGQRSRKQRMT
jgi:hypothetical protein